MLAWVCQYYCIAHFLIFIVGSYYNHIVLKLGQRLPIIIVPYRDNTSSEQRVTYSCIIHKLRQRYENHQPLLYEPLLSILPDHILNCHLHLSTFTPHRTKLLKDSLVTEFIFSSLKKCMCSILHQEYYIASSIDH